MKAIERRTGRLNLTEFLKNGVVRKTCLIKELSRPNRLLREVVVLEKAKLRSIQVPELIGYGKDTKGREYLEVRKISGSSIACLKNHERNEAFAMVGNQMLKTNSLFDGYGWLNAETERGDYSSWKTFLTNFFDKYGKRITDLDLTKKLNRINVRGLIQKIIPDYPETYLIHRDIKPGNLMKDDNGLIWILDWENAILGDPLFDIAQFGANFGHGAQWRALVRGYGLETNCEVYALYEILALIGINVFCQKYGFPKKRKKERLEKLLINIQATC